MQDYTSIRVPKEVPQQLQGYADSCYDGLSLTAGLGQLLADLGEGHVRFPEYGLFQCPAHRREQLRAAVGALSAARVENVSGQVGALPANPYTRVEKDTMGEMEVPRGALWGASTQRAVLNFPVSGLRMGRSFIRALGYRGQMHSPSDETLVYIPMFVNAGLGQLGANGQLLSPHFGSRCRLAMVTTDAPVTYDKPVDYGIHKFCQTCQVCVRRCPAQALVKDKVWWRGVQKNKIIYDRCRPVMARYEGCGVCMKVCPIQRYGMQAVMEHYVATGKVLGKGTDDLESYTLGGQSFGVDELPELDKETFQFPHGPKDQWLFQQFKERLKKEGIPPDDQLQQFAAVVKRIVDKGSSTRYDQIEPTSDIE